MTKLYYECHVTIEPVFDERRELAGRLAQEHGFRLAELLMRKRVQDTEQRSAKDTFMTGHSKDLDDIRDRMLGVVKALQAHEYKVWRYKIEDTIMDSKFEDELGLL